MIGSLLPSSKMSAYSAGSRLLNFLGFNLFTNSKPKSVSTISFLILSSEYVPKETCPLIAVTDVLPICTSLPCPDVIPEPKILVLSSLSVKK